LPVGVAVTARPTVIVDLTVKGMVRPSEPSPKNVSIVVAPIGASAGTVTVTVKVPVLDSTGSAIRSPCGVKPKVMGIS
jgi:hypothetical protein